MVKWNNYNEGKTIGKILDKSSFIHKGTHIQNEYRKFFNATDLDFGDIIYIILKYKNESFEARITKTNPTDKLKSVTRLFWYDDLQNIMCKELQLYYKKLINNETITTFSEISFTKTNIKNEYEITFTNKTDIHESYIIKDVPVVDRIDTTTINSTSLSNDTLTDVIDKHTQIQYYLYELGVRLNFDVWIARNDKSKIYNGVSFKSMPRVLSELPIKFDEENKQRIELIDILWISGKTIRAAFEVEFSTTIDSGLLRMSELVIEQPNLNINLYIVAPDIRADEIKRKMTRPIYINIERPLNKICRFIKFSKLERAINNIQQIGFESCLNIGILDDVSEVIN